MNEDFVSFDLAKKLKEKGFRYNKNKLLDRLCMENQINHPTISQVLKWLREEKKMHVIIATFVDQLNRCYKWGYEIWDISEFPKHIQHVSVKTNFTGHDKAALAGIEYVLDNLI